MLSQYVTQISNNTCDNLGNCQDKDNKVVYAVDSRKEPALPGYSFYFIHYFSDFK